jgi:hypothetical protein
LRAIANFDVNRWDETPFDAPDDGPPQSRVTVSKTFTGELAGTSVAELLTCRGPEGAGYLATERIEGALHGQEGTFVVQHGGLMAGDEVVEQFGWIVPGSGTGALAGITGTCRYTHDASGATLLLDYRIG